MATPDRIVSLVPSHTESLHSLGLADRVVGRTRFCIKPDPWVKGVPIVGGTKDATSQKVLDVKPDLVVADRDENPKALVDELQNAGVEVLWSSIDTVPDAAAFLERLADRCGVPNAGRIAAQNILRTLLQVRHGGNPVPVFAPIWHAPWMTFNRASYCHAMLEAVGLRNVFADRAGPKYFSVEPGEVARSGALWTLLPTEPYPFHKRRGAFDPAELGPCGAPERVRIIDGEALTWFGTRTAPGLVELARVAGEIRTESGFG